jgi:hypothetical protein
MSDRTHSGSRHYVWAVIAALAVVALLAYARGEPGDDGRTPDQEDALVLMAGS